MTISEDAITHDIWEIFYDLLDDITSVTITGNKTITIQNYVSSYPESMLDSKTNYPIMVISSPNFETQPVTYRNPEYTGRIEIEIMTNQSESADKFKDLILKQIRDNLSTLRTEGIDELEIDDDASTHYDRNSIKVHSRKLVWRFKAYF